MSHAMLWLLLVTPPHCDRECRIQRLLARDDAYNRQIVQRDLDAALRACWPLPPRPRPVPECARLP